MKFQEHLMFYPFNREETAISKTLRLWLVFAGEMGLLYGVIVTGAGIQEPAILSIENLDLRVYFHKNTPMRFRKTELKGYPRYLCVWTLDECYFTNIWYFDSGKGKVYSPETSLEMPGSDWLTLGNFYPYRVTIFSAY